MKKYEFTGEIKRIGEIELHRIRALRGFRNVKSGDLGGWIEKEENLSHEGDCWVYGNAWVYGGAQVYGDTLICGGKWEKSPLYIQGTRWSFSIVSNMKIQVGCQRYTWQEWHDRYLYIAAEYGGEDIIPEYVLYFNLACKLYGHEDCMIKEEAEE